MHFTDRSMLVPVEGATWEQQSYLAEQVQSMWLSDDEPPETAAALAASQIEYDPALLAATMARYITLAMPDIHRYQLHEPLESARPLASNEDIPNSGIYALLVESLYIFNTTDWELAQMTIAEQYGPLLPDPHLATTTDQTTIEYKFNTSAETYQKAFARYMSFWAFSMPFGSDGSQIARVDSVHEATRGLAVETSYDSPYKQSVDMEVSDRHFVENFLRQATDPTEHTNPILRHFESPETVGEFDVTKTNSSSQPTIYFRILDALCWGEYR